MLGTVLSTLRISIYFIFPATKLSVYHYCHVMDEETDIEISSNLIKFIQPAGDGAGVWLHSHFTTSPPKYCR